MLPIREVELELKSGMPGRLFEVALGLQEHLPLKLANVSKAERGYRLAVCPANAAADPRRVPPIRRFGLARRPR
jgi:triphosphatase